MPRRTTPAYERALARRVIVPPPPGVEGDCWLYTGATRSQPGGETGEDDYGKIHETVAGFRRSRLVHRVSYEHHFGPISVEIVVRHRCDRRACFAPHHLRPGAASENTYDMIMRGRWKGPEYMAPVIDPVGDGECPF